MENEALSDNDRRDFLVKLTSVVGGVGVGVFFSNREIFWSS